MKQLFRKIFLTAKQLSQGSRAPFTNDAKIAEFMEFFRADEYGHEANISKSDLGYGWLHYGWMRLLKPRRVLCIGSRHGFIPAVLAQGCKDNGHGHVDFVDAGFDSQQEAHWSGVGYWKTPEGEKAFARFGLENHLSLFVMTTSEFARKYNTITYDYIYIDGDHSVAGARFDYKTFWPRLRGGGVMCFHDISIKETKTEGEYGVWKLWDTISKKNAIIVSYTGSGLGFLQKI